MSSKTNGNSNSSEINKSISGNSGRTTIKHSAVNNPVPGGNGGNKGGNKGGGKGK